MTTSLTGLAWKLLFAAFLRRQVETRLRPEEANPPQKPKTAYSYKHINMHTHTRLPHTYTHKTQTTHTHTNSYLICTPHQHTTCNPFTAGDQQQQQPVVLNPHGLLIGVFLFSFSSFAHTRFSFSSHYLSLSPASYLWPSLTGMWLVGSQRRCKHWQ